MSSSTNTVIKTVGLSKVYHRLDVNTKRNVAFSALDDISFELERGEILGVIGSNGSGKSTLLRVLAGITKPSSGTVEMEGGVASILDIGTGFHPDLSGRENTYLRGQLLGMTKREIDKVFDEIVDFSGVGDFIESPAKHYSSGMFLRLAFSVIIHLRSDILLLDEIMSVGDVDFKQKCAQKLTEIVTSGKTVVMVSHDLPNIMDLCSITALLQEGKMVRMDTPTSVVNDSYLSKLAGFKESELNVVKQQLREEALRPRKGEGYELLSLAASQPEAGINSTQEFAKENEVVIDMQYKVDRKGLNFGITINDFLSQRLMDDSPKRHDWEFTDDFVGHFHARWKIPGDLLNPGRYYVTVYLFDDDYKVKKRYMNALEFNIRDDKGILDKNPIYYSPIDVNLGLEFEKLKK